MNKNLFERAKAYILAHHRRSVWYRIMGVLAVCVVFVTTYMLVLPAITMERPTYCGLTEHIHTKECYTEQYLFTCGKLESDEHTHTDDCISAISSLTCTEPEHKHNDYCYMEEIRQEMLTDEILIDNTPEQQALPEVAYEDDAAAEEELTETETETETEAPTILAWDNLDRTADNKNFALRLRTKDGAFADGSVLDVEYMNESAAAPYAESLQAQLASEEADRDVELTAVLPVKISVRDASGNEVPVRGAELSIYLNSMADVTTDTALFAQYETVNAAKWTPVNYVRMLGSAEDGEHLNADVEEGGVFLLANVQYVERATETEAPTETETEAETEAVTEAQTEQAADTSTGAETETETAGPENAAGPSTQPQTEDAAGDGADLETGSESESETETEETTVRVLETKAPETDETGTDTTTETETTETEPEYTCGLEEHTHDASCFAAPKNGAGIEELVCTKKIHKHDASCIGTKETESENEIKAETETANETETETEGESASETEKESETTTESELTGEIETESESEMAELPFGDGGYDSEYGEGFEDNGVLTQGKEPEKESENNETVYQPEYTCGLAEHTHVEACYNEAGELVCGLEEHVHTEECVGELPMMDESGDGTENGNTENGNNGNNTGSSSGTDLMADSRTKVSGSGTKYDPETGDFDTQLRVDYQLTKQEIIDANYEYYINYPEGIIVPPDLITQDPQPFYDENNRSVPAGYYEFFENPDGTYSAKIQFSPDYIAKAGPNLWGHLQFKGYLRHDKVNEDGGFDIPFTDSQHLTIPSGDITYEHDETLQYDIDVTKEGGFSIADNKLRYTVTVKTFKGTPEWIELEDILEAGSLPVKGTPSITVEKETYYHYVGGYDGAAIAKETITPTTNNYDEATKKSELKLPGLPAAGKLENVNGECRQSYRYVITYEYTLDTLPEGFKFDTNNKVSVESKDEKTGEIVKDDASKSGSINTEMTFKKEGWYDAANGRIQWTITVNENGNNIAGAILEDKMLPAEAGQITVTPNEGWALENGHIKFSGVDGTAVNTNKYTIVYYTEAESGWNTSVTNDALFDKDGDKGTTGDQKKDSYEVKTDGGDVKKNLVETGKPDDKTVELTWKTQITVPKGGLPTDIELFDDALHSEWGNPGKRQYMTKKQILEWVGKIVSGSLASSESDAINWPTGGSYTITFTGEDGETYTYDQLTGTEEISTVFTGFRIVIHSLPSLEKDSTFWFTYKTTADLSDTVMGSNVYYNMVDFGGRKSQDTYDFKEGGIVKTDENGNKEPVDVENEGTLTWKVKACLDSREQYKKLTITDQLPEHIFLNKLQVKGEDLSINEDGTFSGIAWGTYKIEGTYKVSRKITINVTKTDGGFMPAGEEFEAILYCGIDKEGLGELEAGAKYSFKNEATVSKDGKDFGTANQTQNWSEKIHEEEEKELTKLGVWDNNNRKIDYTVVINPEGSDLVPDTDVLTLTDTLQYVERNYTGALKWDFNQSVLLDQSTVKLYAAVKDENGNWVPDKDSLVDWEWVYNVKKENTYYNGDRIFNIITAKIPDGKALILQYSYIVQMTVPPEEIWPTDDKKNLDVSNTVKLEGTSHQDTSNNSQDQYGEQTSGGGITTDKSYTFFKVEKGNYGIAVQGATFAVYKWDGTNSNPATPIWETVTDKSGRFQIVWKDNDIFEKNTIYYAVEKQAAEGYIMPENPPRYYFYFSDSTGSLPENIPDGAIDLSVATHSEYIENEKNYTDIGVDKKWIDASGADVTDEVTEGKVTFTIKQRASLTPPGGAATGGTTGGSTGSGSSQGTGTINVICKNINGKIEQEKPIDYIDGATVRIIVTTKGYRTWFPTLQAQYGDDSYIKSEGSNEGDEFTVDESSGNAKFTFDFVLNKQTNIEISSNDSQSETILGLDVEYISIPQPDTDIESESGGDSGDDTEVDLPEATFGPYEITSEMDWKWRSKYVGLKLPKTGTYNGRTVYYTYYIEEQNAEFYNAEYSQNNENGGILSGNITVINKVPDKEMTSISVQKQWDENGTVFEGTHDPIVVQLYKKGATEADDVPIGGTHKLNEGNHWTYTWTEEIEEGFDYFVKEMGVPSNYDYKVTYSYNGVEKEVEREVTAKPDKYNPTLLIKNTRKTTSVAVRKVWQSADGKQKDADAELPEITVHLWKKGEMESESDTEIEPAVKLGNKHASETNYTDNGWCYTWPNLPEGEYYVVEDLVEGYIISYSTGSEAQSKDAKSVTVQNGTITVTNTEEPTEFEVEKKWQDNASHSIDNGQPVTVELYSSTTPPETEAQTVPVDPDPDPANPETDESESDKEEPEEQTVEPRLILNVQQWLNADNTNAEAPTEGWIWAQVFECGEGTQTPAVNEKNEWKTYIRSGDLNNSNGWKIEWQLPKMKVSETKSYYVQFGAGNSEKGDFNRVGDTGLLSTGNKNFVVTVSGTEIEKTYQLKGVLASQGTQKTIKVDVTIDKWLKEDKSLRDSLTTENNVWGWICVYELSNGDNSNYWEYPLEKYKNSIEFGPHTNWKPKDEIVLPETNRWGTNKYRIQVGIGDKSNIIISDHIPNETFKYEKDIDSSQEYYDIHLVVTVPDSIILPPATSASYTSIGTYSPYRSYSPISNTASSGSSTGATVGSKPTITAPTITNKKDLPSGAVLVNAVELGNSHANEISKKEDGTEVGKYDGTGWRFTWENLPKTNEKGEPLYYYVVEETNSASSTAIDYQYHYWDDSKKWEGFKGATITNTTPPTMGVTVNKQWLDGTGNPMETGRGPIDVTLSNSSGTVSDTVTLNAENDWRHTWTDLPIDTYTVQEKLDENSPYTVTYETDGNTVTITNQSTDIAVEKKWLGIDGTGNPTWKPDKVTVQLYRVNRDDEGELVEDDVELNEGNGWRHEWNNLPLGEYYVVEDELEDDKSNAFTATYSLTDPTAPAADESGSGTSAEAAGKEKIGSATPSDVQATEGTIYVINQEDSTEFKVEKKWANEYIPAADESVTVQLYQTTDESEAEKENNSTSSTNSMVPVTLAKNMAATKTTRAVSATGTSITVRIGNWQNGGSENAQRPEAGWAWMRIWRCDEKGNRIDSAPIYPETGGVKILSYENNWSVTAANLPQYVMSNGEIKTQYYYVEFGANGAGNSIVNVALADGSSNGCIVPGTNASSDLTLTATLGEGTGMSIMTRTKVAVMRAENAEEVAEANTSKEYGGADGEIVLSSKNEWEYTWENLPKYDKEGNPLYYYVKELGTEKKYAPEYSRVVGADGVTTVTITNTKLVSVTVEKKWKDFPEEAGEIRKTYKVEIQLLKDGEPVGEHALEDEITGSNWSYTWEGLPPGNYTVREVLVYTTVDGKTVQFTEYRSTTSENEIEDGSGNYKYTITNTYNPNQYVLPETGGPGTLPYTVGGTLLMAFASLLLYIQNKRRKEGQHTS